ncbi:MAG: hypothetical protein ACOVNY_01505 [Chitinophagaceae bacterium]
MAQKKKKQTKTTINKKKKVVSKKSKPARSKRVVVTNKPKANVGAEIKEVSIKTAIVDTTSLPKEVVITSAFKPSLRNAAKINFTAATPLLDTVKVPQSYNIPSQSLFFSYQPVAIKPLAYTVDTSIFWQQQHFVKLGFGNFSSPYIETGIGFGNGRKSMGLFHAKYQSAKGNIPLQEYNHLAVDVKGNFELKNNHALSGKIFFSNNTQYQYGFSPANSNVTKQDARQRFTTIGVNAVFKNLTANEHGIQYQPNANISFFTNGNGTNEINLLLAAPFQKKLNENLSIHFKPTADITAYKSSLTNTSVNINNNLWYIHANAKYIYKNVTLTAGLLPSWDNKSFKLLPNIFADVLVHQQKLIAQFGWVGYFQKNSYQQLTNTNPFLDPVTTQANTLSVEQFAGLKGSLNQHFSYNAKLSFVQMKNAVLFNNFYYLNNQNFKTIVSPEIQAIRIKGELGYAIQDKFSVLASATFNQFTKIELFQKAYGLVPLELNGSLLWKVLKDVQIKSDILFMSGNTFADNVTNVGNVKPAIDVNIGTEFLVLPKLNAWIQFNNMLNNKYQRWNQYQVLGFQVLAGVVYSFR